ncbi:MAG: zinc ribbon domain-containing protein, partial [Acidimicrobiales bacterium]|nr:zinc ribbon domain-containing protein [Acidimicrobiales bacterium]
MPADLFCTKCGHRNAIDARFCSSCGAAMEVGDSGEETTITFAPVDATGEILDEDMAVAMSELAEAT